MTTVSLVIIIASLCATIYVLRNLSHAANQPCNGEDKQLQELEKIIKFKK